MLKPCLTPLAALAVALAAASAGHANPLAKRSRAFDQHITLTALGDATVRLKWQLPAAEYAELMRRLGGLAQRRDPAGNVVAVRVPPTAKSLIAYLNLDILDVATRDLVLKADATKGEITATFTIAGWARPTGATTWAVEVLDNARWYDLLANWLPPLAGTRDFATRAAAPKLRFDHTADNHRGKSLVRGEVTLPAGASRARLSKQEDGRWAVTYQLAAPRATNDHAGDVSFKVEPRREVMPAAHKLYSDPAWPTYWLARTLFRNASGDRVSAVRARARVHTSAGQTAWSEWEEVAAVVHPGQSAQFALTPVLDAKALMLTSKETAKLSVELEYTRDGKKVTVARTTRLAVLGRNDIATSNIDVSRLESPSWYHFHQEDAVVAAAFITPHDSVVKELKGLISKRIGGVAVYREDAGAAQFAKALYDFFRANIAYSSPTATHGESGKLFQHINYARNVLKNGTGTCVDLAFTYASTLEAAGMEAGVVWVPGHVFAYFVLPKSGRRVYVETTGCRAGTLEESTPFALAVQAGAAHLQKDQPHHVCDLTLMRRYVSAPELPELDVANPLTAWGRQMPPPCPEVTLGAPRVEQNASHDGKAGLKFHYSARIHKGTGQKVNFTLRLLHGSGKPVVRADNTPLVGELAIKANKDGERWDNWVFFSYEELGFAGAFPKWYEYRVLIDAVSAAYREGVAANPTRDRFVMRRAEVGGKLITQSIVFSTYRAISRDGKLGYDVVIKDVVLGTGALGDGATVRLTLSDFDTAAYLRDPAGEHLHKALPMKGTPVFWYADGELPKCGKDGKSLPLVTINFYDAGGSESRLLLEVAVELKP